ncbi:GDSL-type esterase/lipase family protein [Fredinandcohnia sp. QZ13]|uniref:SGNH/GDSL hydrolase family protein n=1 Tax=Fredinandcohnia sp. QZ13 TaxID=3073144 RepID=UPI00285308E2|nr:GDSL-type esterase/lipase family protein [Fredinandcohnia sp. QZ13]MDR4887760.1 GDSL-type esterase/lipase family protein [Fredinandcohnia sp. QZ13]
MKNPSKVYLFYFISALLCVFVLLTIQQKGKAARPVSISEHKYTIIEKLNHKRPVTIVAYGDSITWGYDRDTRGIVSQVQHPYPKVLEKQLRKKYGYNKINVINKGHPGWTSIQALENLEEEVLSYHPDLVISMFGINDARGHMKYSPHALPVPVDHYKENNRQILQKLKENGIEVVVISPTTITNNKNNGKKTQVYYITAIKSLAQEEKIQYVNGGDISIHGNLYDGIHFKKEKYRLIAEKLMSAIF